jgi:hypothetical protein
VQFAPEAAWPRPGLGRVREEETGQSKAANKAAPCPVPCASQIQWATTMESPSARLRMLRFQPSGPGANVREVFFFSISFFFLLFLSFLLFLFSFIFCSVLLFLSYLFFFIFISF